MIVRFDPKKLQANTTTDIGMESDPATLEKGAVSEVEMIVNEARRHSGLHTTESMALSEVESEELKQMVIEEQQEEQEPGPELTPEGQAQAQQLLSQKSQGLEPVDSAKSES